MNDVQHKKVGNFLSGFGAAIYLAEFAKKNKRYLEIVCLSATIIDGLLRLSLVMKQQLLDKSENFEERLLFQGKNDKNFITEKNIYQRALKEKITNSMINKKLYKLYAIRNRIIHGYIISDIKTLDIQKAALGYDQMVTIIGERHRKYEMMVNTRGIGLGKYLIDKPTDEQMIKQIMPKHKGFLKKEIKAKINITCLMAFNLLFSINNFSISNSEANYSFNSMRLSNDPGLLNSLFFTKNFISRIGTNDLRMVESNSFYYKENFQPVSNLSSNDLIHEETEKILHLLECLWFVKDNSSSLHKVFSEDFSTGDVITNMRIPMVSNCEGRFDPTVFTVSELLEAERILNLLNALSTRKIHPNIKLDTRREGLNNTIENFQIYNSNSRIEKALIFLGVARCSILLAQKISNYIPIYECLFTPAENTEVTHKICERVALYIGLDKEDKINTYLFLKDVYNFRSQFFHGNALSNQFNHLEAQQKISSKIDALTRKILKKVILEDSELFLKTDTELKNYFTSLVFN